MLRVPASSRVSPLSTHSKQVENFALCPSSGLYISLTLSSFDLAAPVVSLTHCGILVSGDHLNNTSVFLIGIDFKSVPDVFTV